MKRLFGEPAQAHINVELLSAFLDGQVSQAERALIEGHLSGCALCRDELESLRRTVSLMQALPRVRVPHAFTLSEAMVGGRKPATGASWLGGLARGLGAVAAVALVVVLASTLLRQPMAVPLPPVARSVPTVASPEPAAELFAAPAAVPEKAAEATEEPIIAAARTQQGTSETPATPIVAIAPAADQLQPTAAPASPTEIAPVARAAAPSATPEPPMLAMGAPGATETPAGPARALAPGENALGAAALPAQSLTPEPLPPMAAIADVWPNAARLVYTDAQALWALDRAEGLRQVVVGQALSSPLISPDGDYVVYSAMQEGRTTLWGLPWRGGKPRLLLDEAQLPKDRLAPQYRERRVQDVSWVPGQRALALLLMAVPAPAATEAMPLTELWTLEVETGTLRFIAAMGRAYRPYYAPDGSRFALLEYGTEADPQGRLT
ncbi:MAG: zf-HC2 domain-containing protein, partial [Anaerolineae bacterium]|nr:zf-HC2 domain-containing protein [Anaerolineae bacterium]